MLVPLFAAIAPLLLWPIEVLLPYPHIIEELAKAVLIFFTLKLATSKSRVTQAIAVGVLFAMSESVLYLFNIFAVGNLSTFVNRLFLTIPLHAVTSLLILLPAMKDKRLIILGIPFAIAVHYLFNLYIA